jgi:hypothetical protein
MNPKLTPERLSRKAVVYVRQSKPSQLIHNQESTRLQFSLADRARTLGFQRIVVVDDVATSTVVSTRSFWPSSSPRPTATRTTPH